MALLRRTTNDPLERKILRASLTTGVAHHYISYDSASDSFLENSQVRRKESKLPVRGRNEASLTIHCHPVGLVSTLEASVRRPVVAPGSVAAAIGC